VRESVRDVQYTLIATLVLVVLVIFLFLRKLTATLIPSLAMPLAIVGTFAAMYLLGYSLDNLSLMALTLCVGFVVDDAIVMLENIVRHMEAGKPPLQAALDGSREIGFTIVSMTCAGGGISPFLFMGGILGRLFEEFAVTIAVAILLSGVVSLTLTPMLAARMIRAEHGEKHGRFYVTVERGFQGLLGVYDRVLGFVLRHRRLALVFSAVILAATVLVFQRIPKGFLPTEDNSQIFVTTEAVEGISFSSAAERQRQLANIVMQDPAVVNFMSSIGSRGGIGGTNQGMMFIRLKNRGERPPIDAVIARLRGKLGAVPGMKVFLQVPPQIRLGGRLTRSEYQVTLEGTDPRELYRLAPLLAREIDSVPGVRDIATDLQLKNPQIQLDIDRERAAALGVSAEQIEDALYSAYGSRQISSIYAADNTYAVILELMPELQREPTDLDDLYVRSTTGRPVPLRAVAAVSRGVGPLSVNHAGQLPAVTVSFNLEPGHSLSEAVGGVQAVADRILPSTITARFQGAAEAFQSSLSGLGMLLIVSIFVIYLARHPVRKLIHRSRSCRRARRFRALYAVHLQRRSRRKAFVGVIRWSAWSRTASYAGLRARGAEGPEQARDRCFREACIVRFRPIMMMTMAACSDNSLAPAGAGAESPPAGLPVGGPPFSWSRPFVTPVFTYMTSCSACGCASARPKLPRRLRPPRIAVCSPRREVAGAALGSKLMERRDERRLRV
jgi:HAE1 family hydrophobic/amphiphilic exporter-1